MRFLGIVFPLLLVLCLAFWAYQENILTKQVSERVSELKENISRNREMRKFLQDEWAYLNRPDRLKELVNVHFEELRLSAVTHFKFRPATTIPLQTASVPQMDIDSGLLLAAPKFVLLEN